MPGGAAAAAPGPGGRDPYGGRASALSHGEEDPLPMPNAGGGGPGSGASDGAAPFAGGVYGAGAVYAAGADGRIFAATPDLPL